MKGARIVSVAVFAAALAAVALSVFDAGGPSGATGGRGFRARVVATDDSDLTTLGFVRYGTQTMEVELPDASRRRAANVMRGQMELDSFCRPGDSVLVTAPSAGSPDDPLVVRSHWRLGPMAWAFGLFALLLVAFGGIVGLNALSSFMICCVVIWKFVIPLILSGRDASLVAFLATAAMTFVIMLLVGGWTRKALAAFGGSMLGVAAGLALAHVFGALMGVNGATLPFVQTLVYSGAASLDLADVFIAATVIAASGAMMDLSMDIAAGVCEVARHNPALGFRELAMSGLRIGRATVGTMTTTLLLAYSGGYLTLLMVFAAQGTPCADFLNSPIVAAEVAKTLVGSFAIVLVAPFTALVSALLSSRRR
ncbi:MAG: YibE/F family protein [Kiritimatiellae bacterium]|nr:YibE/F family protein [Kiritimatiellia bacterium]